MIERTMRTEDETVHAVEMQVTIALWLHNSYKPQFSECAIYMT